MPGRLANAFLIVGAILSLVFFSLISFPSAAAPRVQSTDGGPPIVLLAGHADSPFRVPPPASFSQLHVQTATISVNFLQNTTNYFGDYCYAWPASAQTAFSYAVSLWASQITSAVSIRINACWTSLAKGVLGHSGARARYANFPGAPIPDTWYPVALASALGGVDLNGNDPEIEVAYSMNVNWYFPTDGRPPKLQYDFVSVVLHEICHGLGFSGSMSVSGGLGRWGSYGYPFAYDRFTQNGDGQSLLGFYSPSVALAKQLTSDNLYFAGTYARAANGGSPVKLYAPSPWMQGSSYSHLDESFNGTSNALMTYSLDDGEAVHDPGDITRGILRDVGWNAPPVSPTPTPGAKTIRTYFPFVANR